MSKEQPMTEAEAKAKAEAVMDDGVFIISPRRA